MFESLKVFFINKVAIFMMSAKWATVTVLEVRLFWNKVYDVRIFVYGVISRILWLKFGIWSISMREVIITSILHGLDQKNQVFSGCSWPNCNYLGIVLGMTILRKCGKTVETEIQKYLLGVCLPTWSKIQLLLILIQ